MDEGRGRGGIHGKGHKDNHRLSDHSSKHKRRFTKEVLSDMLLLTPY